MIATWFKYIWTKNIHITQEKVLEVSLLVNVIIAITYWKCISGRIQDRADNNTVSIITTTSASVMCAGLAILCVTMYLHCDWRFISSTIQVFIRPHPLPHPPTRHPPPPKMIKWHTTSCFMFLYWVGGFVFFWGGGGGLQQTENIFSKIAIGCTEIQCRNLN